MKKQWGDFLNQIDSSLVEAEFAKWVKEYDILAVSNALDSMYTRTALPNLQSVENMLSLCRVFKEPSIPKEIIINDHQDSVKLSFTIEWLPISDCYISLIKDGVEKMMYVSTEYLRGLPIIGSLTSSSEALQKTTKEANEWIRNTFGYSVANTQVKGVFKLEMDKFENPTTFALHRGASEFGLSFDQTNTYSVKANHLAQTKNLSFSESDKGIFTATTWIDAYIEVKCPPKNIETNIPFATVHSIQIDEITERVHIRFRLVSIYDKALNQTRTHITIPTVQYASDSKLVKNIVLGETAGATIDYK